MCRGYYSELGVLDSQMGEQSEIKVGRRRPELRLNLSTCYLDSRTRFALDNRPRTDTRQAVTPYDRPNARQNTSSNLGAHMAGKAPTNLDRVWAKLAAIRDASQRTWHAGPSISPVLL